ncbi:MAG: hypothetical protein H7833_04265 [Magnetococcus sp. DMHC-1]|nr:hypothetical protein [Magnetococcales bacterium]
MFEIAMGSVLFFRYQRYNGLVFTNPSRKIRHDNENKANCMPATTGTPNPPFDPFLVEGAVCLFNAYFVPTTILPHSRGIPDQNDPGWP